MPGKRGRPSLKRELPKNENSVEHTDAKKIKVSHPSHAHSPGEVLALGEGDVGQLGLGSAVTERKRPALVPLSEKAVQAEAGGMHTVVLTESGQVLTFGCNDEGALGRVTAEEEDEAVAGVVQLADRVVQVSAGDSHTAALTQSGSVYVWGTFRDNNGVIGLLKPMEKCPLPALLPLETPIVKVASGNDHLVLLSQSGDLYTLGCGEQGQLGRVPECFSSRGGRRGLERLLVPQPLRFKALKGTGALRFADVFCGAYCTFAISRDGHVYGFGLSNYYQLGTLSTKCLFVPKLLAAFKNSTNKWSHLAGGQHHSLCLDSEGRVYSVGRADYGRLGLGEGAAEAMEPMLVPGLGPALSVACGASVSYAVTKDGSVYAWGMGTNHQLGRADDEDAWSPERMEGKQLEGVRVLAASSGGQHTVLVVARS
uniref:Regulator of chromosome condensation-like n=1 Tax=Petromyzon marinus TaxID=7757 RepID=A0AAJ7TCR9_PETMA|nr:regulator of chromosome condensation-like [Petromyzon marinus]XP_032815547.1 regulator of chromosome condensation-like [Petromyzon marinus]